MNNERTYTVPFSGTFTITVDVLNDDDEELALYVWGEADGELGSTSVPCEYEIDEPELVTNG
jgi:hypothetical protein